MSKSKSDVLSALAALCEEVRGATSQQQTAPAQRTLVASRNLSTVSADSHGSAAQLSVTSSAGVVGAGVGAASQGASRVASIAANGGASQQQASASASPADVTAAALSKIEALLGELRGAAEGGASDHPGDDCISLAIPPSEASATAVGGANNKSLPSAEAHSSGSAQQASYSSSSAFAAPALPPPHTLSLATLIPNALVTTHVASTLFIMLDTLASSLRASWGMLFVFNDTLGRLVLAASCGQRYARPGSLTIAVASNHFQPSIAAAAEAATVTAPPGGGVAGLQPGGLGGLGSPLRPKPPAAAGGGKGGRSPQHPSGTTVNNSSGNTASTTLEAQVMETGIGVNLSVAGGGADYGADGGAGAGSSANSGAIVANVESMDTLYHAREMAMLLTSSPAPASANGSVAAANSGGNSSNPHEAKVRLSSEVAKAHRTRNILVLPVFRPGSHNTEVIGLLELGNKLGDEAFTAAGGEASSSSSSSALVPFTEEDECRAVEAAAFFANIVAKYPHDIGHKNSHNHGINDRLAALVAGLPAPSYANLPAGHPQQQQRGGGAPKAAHPLASPSASQGVASNSSPAADTAKAPLRESHHSFNYFGASVLRTSALRAPQLIYRSYRKRFATVRRADLRQGSALVSFKGGADEWREVAMGASASQQQPPAGGSTSPLKGGAASSAGPSSAFSVAAEVASLAPVATAPHKPLRSPRSAAAATAVVAFPCVPAAAPPAYLPQLQSGATVTDALEHTLQMGESWRNAVLLNVSLEAEMRRLHEALRISRRETARLQDMLVSMRQGPQGQGYGQEEEGDRRSSSQQQQVQFQLT